jgi:hypothetical protein
MEVIAAIIVAFPLIFIVAALVDIANKLEKKL